MSGIRILVVDDERAFLIAARKILGDAGIEVDTAETQEAAEVLLAQHEYAAVIADLRLTGSGGEEGLEIARIVQERCPSTTMMLITGYGTEEVKRRAEGLDVEFYFEKPVSIELLREALNEIHLVNGTDPSAGSGREEEAGSGSVRTKGG